MYQSLYICSILSFCHEDHQFSCQEEPLEQVMHSSVCSMVQKINVAMHGQHMYCSADGMLKTVLSGIQDKMV